MKYYTRTLHFFVTRKVLGTHRVNSYFPLCVLKLGLYLHIVLNIIIDLQEVVNRKHVKWCTILFKVLPFLLSMSTIITILNCYMKTKENKVTRKKQEGFQYFIVNIKPLAKLHNKVR